MSQISKSNLHTSTLELFTPAHLPNPLDWLIVRLLVLVFSQVRFMPWMYFSSSMSSEITSYCLGLNLDYGHLHILATDWPFLLCYPRLCCLTQLCLLNNAFQWYDKEMQNSSHIFTVTTGGAIHHTYTSGLVCWLGRNIVYLQPHKPHLLNPFLVLPAISLP